MNKAAILLTVDEVIVNEGDCFSKNKLVFDFSSKLFQKRRNKHCFFVKNVAFSR